MSSKLFLNFSEIIMCYLLIYIKVAMKGQSYMRSAYEAFGLVSKNIMSIGTLNAVSNFVIFISKMFITISCVSILFCLMDSNDDYIRGGKLEVVNPWLPLLICGFMSYFVASVFFSRG